MPVIVEHLKVPSSFEHAPAPMERTVLGVVHLVQYGIVPERITLPHSNDGILCGYDEDVSSIRNDCAPGFAQMRHLVTSGSAKPVRDSQEGRHSSPNPVYRFDNNRPNRLLEQTLFSI